MSGPIAIDDGARRGDAGLDLSSNPVPATDPQPAPAAPDRRLPAVAVYRATLFKPSETFIHHQAAALSTHRASLVGLVADRQPPTEELDHRLAPPDLRTAAALLTGRPPRALTTAIEATSPSLIHAHFGPDGTQVLPVARRLDLPLVVTLHGHDVFVRGGYRTPQRVSYLLRRSKLLAQADRVVCVSDFLHRAVRDLDLPPGVELVRHRIGIDIDALTTEPSTPPEARHTICFVGRLAAKKGIDDVARVVRRLRQRGLTNPVEIIGDGPQAQVVATLEREVADVTWHRARPHADVVELLGRSRIALLPSQTGPNGDAESLGLVFAEALARGCVPVGYDHGGVGEVVPAPLLCTEGDAEALAVNAEIALRSPSARADLRAEGLDLIRHRFDLRRQTGILEELYRDVVR